MNFTLLRFEKLESTNTEAARQARQGAPEGLCVIAREQTAGRGRHGRQWFSAHDAGLFFSVVLKPGLDAKFLPLITLMSGVAVADSLKSFGLATDIKWVNDVLVGEKKISGILAETVETPQGIAVVVGIGINLKASELPADVAARATSIAAETGRDVTADEMATSLTGYLGHFYDILCAPEGRSEILGHWKDRSSYFRGKSVSITLPDGKIVGTTDGVEENGALRVKMADGSVRIVQSGEVEQLRGA